MTGAVGVVVVSYNSAEDLPSCLAALMAADGVARVVVVDNASSDTSREVVLQNSDGRVELLTLETNTGFAGGCNRGFAAIAEDCEIVAFVNPDVAVAHDCLRLAAEALAADPGLAGVAPRLMRGDGVTVDSVGQVLDPVTLEVRDRGYGKALVPELLSPRPVLAACGALAVFRRDALVDVAEREGPWAEQYFCFWEDRARVASGQCRSPDFQPPRRGGGPRSRRRRHRGSWSSALAETGRTRGLRHHQSLDDPDSTPQYP